MSNITLEIVNPLDRESMIEVEIEFTVTPAEEDVGIMSWGIEDESIVATNSPDAPSIDQIERALTPKDWDTIREQIHSKYEPDDNYDPDQRDPYHY